MKKIAVLGYGVVGSGTVEILYNHKESIEKKIGESYEVKYILDLRDFPDSPYADKFTKSFDDIVNDKEVDIVVEVLGGVKFAYPYVKASLEAGKSVVTSNKELVAAYGAELLKIAREKDVNFFFEASVGGGIPIIRQLFHCFSCNEISEISGILNGTTNYILTQMFKNGESYEEALNGAQEKGYAEKDPTADVDGHDTCKKICILSSVISGKSIDFKNVYTEGIRKITKEDTEFAQSMGYCIRLLGECKIGDDESMEVHVAPMLIKDDHILSKIEDVYNGIVVKGSMTDDTMSYGRGAGKLPTASAVVADAIEVEKNKDVPYIRPWERCDKNLVLDHDLYERQYYLRIKTDNRYGLRNEVNERFKIVDSCDTPSGEVAIITEKTTFKEIKNYKPQFGEVLSIIELMK